MTDANSPVPMSLGEPAVRTLTSGVLAPGTLSSGDLSRGDLSARTWANRGLSAGDPSAGDPSAGDPSAGDPSVGEAVSAAVARCCLAPPGPDGPRPRRQPIECGDLPFLIRRDGSWLYRGSPIERKELVCLFASVLRRDADGGWWLRTPAERGRIEVEDAPFVAVEMEWAGNGRQQVLSFRTNTDQVVAAGPGHPIRVTHDLLTCEPTPYILLREGDGPHGIEARVNRAVYYELVALAVPEYVGPHLMLGVWSSGLFFPLGFMPDEDGEDAL